MSGICGIVNYKDGIISPGTLEKMNASLTKRGPDDEGIHINYAGYNTSAAIAMRQLSLIDFERSHQPIFNGDHSKAIVSDGAIYNWRELREELEEKDHFFYTQSDAEVILHLYEEYGKNFLKRLRGSFAFAIWDSTNKKLFAARDHTGQKPLYYTTIDGNFYFASQLRAFEAIKAFKKRVSRKAIDRFLLYQYIPAPLTIWEDVFKLPAGNLLELEHPGTLSISPYWDINFIPKTKLKYNEAKEKLKFLLENSVKDRMIANVETGAFLSGGIDSSIIVALMSQLSSKPVKTFSVGFSDQDFSELKYARLVSEKYSTRHQEFIMKPEFLKRLPEIIRNHDQPFADPSALPSHYLSKMAASEVKLALGGDAADENFAGYRSYKALSYSKYLSWPAKFIPEYFLDFAAKNIKNPYLHKVLSKHIKALKNSPAGRNLCWRANISIDLIQEIYSEEMLDALYEENPESYLIDVFNNSPAFSIIDRALYTDLRTYLPDNLNVKMDIASMSNSLEVWSPFQDYKLIEFAASLPDKWKLKGKTSKYILKDTFSELLPQKIIKRPKQGFGLPLARWFREEESNYIKSILLSEKALSRGYFKAQAIRRIVDDHMAGKADYAYPIWTLLVLELWHREVLD